MAKVCPITNAYVLYLDCLECDWPDECKKPQTKELTERGNELWQKEFGER